MAHETLLGQLESECLWPPAQDVSQGSGRPADRRELSEPVCPGELSAPEAKSPGLALSIKRLVRASNHNCTHT